MTQKCGGRPLTDEEMHGVVLHALALEEKKELRRFGKEAEANRIDVKDMITPFASGEKIVLSNQVSGQNSLSAVEWGGMEQAMPAEEKITHKNLAAWMVSRASGFGVTQEKEEDEDDDEDDPEIMKMLNAGGGEEGGDGGDEEEEAPPAGAPSKKKEEEEDAVEVKKDKNWSAVNCAYKESKLSFRGVLTPVAFTNWLWHRCIRPKLEDTKSKLPEISDLDFYGIQDVEDIFGEFMPVEKVKKDDKDKDKKDKKDDGKKDKKDDKKGKDDKDDKKADKKGDKKDDKKKKNKKDQVVLNSQEKLQVAHLIKNMIYGLDGKSKTIVTGWANMVAEGDIPLLTPWEFQIAHVARQCMQLEYTAKKKKENPEKKAYYEMVQGLADAISTLRRQYKFEFESVPQEQILPLVDVLHLQERFRDGSCGTLKFDMLWYLEHGAHLLAGSNFMKRHRSTVFKPFLIQEQVVDAINCPGPQLLFAIAPPGTGKTAIVSHLLNCFPGHSLVFCCAALPVVLGVGRISNSLGIPYAFVKGRRITPSYACGRGLGAHVDKMPDAESPEGMTAMQSLKYTIIKMNLERKKKRLAEKKRLRNQFNLKRNPRMFLMCDTSSCAWLLRQLDSQRTLLVIDEPPMGADNYPENPADNNLACAMSQTMMTPMYKTVWMSATLPRAEYLPTLVNSFLDRFRVPREERSSHVRECFSTELDRGALMCGPSGHVAFPHMKCRTAQDLKNLVTRLPGDPLVMKAYTERALAGLLTRWQALKDEGKLSEKFTSSIAAPEVKFADLSELNHASIRAYALELLTAVAAEGTDELTQAFCLPRDASEKGTFPEFSMSEILFSNAYAYPGLTLVAGDDPKGILLSMTQRLQEQMPKASDLEDDIKAQEALQTKQEKYAEEGETVETAATKLKFSPDLVIQSEAFLKRWCPSRPENAPTIMRILPTIVEFLKIKELPVDERWQMLALSGAGSVDPKLDSDPGNPLYTQWVHDAMTLNKLACVTAGKEFTWGANVPASTVVVTKTFAENTSVAGILQYVGRAARRGLTTHGQAIFEREEDLDRIFAPTEGLSTEARTMERYAEWWLSEGKTW